LSNPLCEGRLGIEDRFERRLCPMHIRAGNGEDFLSKRAKLKRCRKKIAQHPIRCRL
jgi:hypothetical protein